jgi:hypothetical protein
MIHCLLSISDTRHAAIALETAACTATGAATLRSYIQCIQQYLSSEPTFGVLCIYIHVRGRRKVARRGVSLQQLAMLTTGNEYCCVANLIQLHICELEQHTMHFNVYTVALLADSSHCCLDVAAFVWSACTREVSGCLYIYTCNTNLCKQYYILLLYVLLCSIVTIRTASIKMTALSKTNRQLVYT